MIKRSLLLLVLLIFPLFIFSQEEEEDKKMVREVITVQVDKAKFAPPPQPATPVAEAPGKKKKKQQQTEEPPPVVADTGNSMIPAPVSEISKRAGNWLNAKSTKYTKANGATSGNTTSCTITFPFKQKTLNPEDNVDGKISMDVIVEAKEGKYRYTIKNIKHVADKAGMSGGSIFEAVPECGSMKCTDLTWKHIKSAAYADIQMVSDDLKAKMREEGDQKKKDDW